MIKESSIILLLLICFRPSSSISQSLPCINLEAPETKFNGVTKILKLDKDVDEKTYIVQQDLSKWKTIPNSGFRSTVGNDAFLTLTKICPNKSGSFFLLIDDSSIHEIKVYLKSNSENGSDIVSVREFGNYNKYIYKVDLLAEQEYELFIYSRETNGSIITKYTLYDEEIFFSTVNKQESSQGIILGITLTIFFISIGLCILTKNSLFLYYALYLLGFIFFISARAGLMKYYFPNLFRSLTDMTTWFGVLLTITMMINLSRKYLELEKYNALFDKFLKSLVIIYVINYVLTFFCDLVVGIIPTFFVYTSLLFISLYPAILILVLIYYYYQTKDKKSLYLVAVFILSLFSFLIMIIQYSSDYTLDIFRYLKWMIVVELLVIFFLISKYNFETIIMKLTTSNQLLEIKTKQLNALDKARRNERMRISNFLHNQIGSKMGALKMGLSESKFAQNIQITKLVDNISEEIRMVSHNLNPEILYKKGFIKAIEQEVFKLEDLNPTLVINLEYNQSNNSLSKVQSEVLYNCYLEITQNILKHNKVRQLSINFISNEGGHQLSIEDDGNHFNPNLISTGSGFNRIITELKTINGELIVSEGKLLKGMQHNIKLKSN